MSYYLDASKFIAKEESFIDHAIWDVNAYRIGYGSDTITLDNTGKFRKVVKGDKTTKELATIDLARRIPKEFEAVLKKQIGAGYNKLNDCAKVALLSFVYNYGSIRSWHKNILKFGKEGNNIELANAIVNDTLNDNPNLSLNVRNALKNRRKRERDYILNCVIPANNNNSQNLNSDPKKKNNSLGIIGKFSINFKHISIK